MKIISNTFLKNIKAIIIIFALVCTTNINAQGPTAFGDNVQDVDPPDAIPLDGGLSILLLGAAAFGVKKLRDNRKKDM